MHFPWDGPGQREALSASGFPLLFSRYRQRVPGLDCSTTSAIRSGVASMGSGRIRLCGRTRRSGADLGASGGCLSGGHGASCVLGMVSFQGIVHHQIQGTVWHCCNWRGLRGRAHSGGPASRRHQEPRGVSGADLRDGMQEIARAGQRGEAPSRRTRGFSRPKRRSLGRFRCRSGGSANTLPTVKAVPPNLPTFTMVRGRFRFQGAVPVGDRGAGCMGTVMLPPSWMRTLPKFLLCPT